MRWSVGSVMPNVNCSCSRVAPIVPPNFTLWVPSVMDEVRFHAHVRQRAILTDRRRACRRADWRSGRYVRWSSTNETIRGEQRVRADHARVARRDVERANVLVLRLGDADRRCSARRIQIAQPERSGESCRWCLGESRIDRRRRVDRRCRGALRARAGRESGRSAVRTATGNCRPCAIRRRG